MTERTREEAFISFCKRVGIVAGAAVAVITLAQIISTAAVAVASRPIMGLVSDERNARIAGQLDVIDVLSAPIGPERDAKISRARARLEREQEKR